MARLGATDPSALRRLQATKLVRSIGQGALAVTFTLYLKELGWSAPAIGLLLTAGGLLTAPVGLVVGALSDRVGRKGFVLGFEVITAASAVILTLTAHPAALALLSLIAGFGRNQSGVPGAAAPAEQAWIAVLIRPEARGRVYSNNSALGFFGMAIGSVLAGSIPLVGSWLPGPLAYRPLFALTAATALLNLFWLLSAAGGETSSQQRRAAPAHPLEPANAGSAPASVSQAPASAIDVTAAENGAMLKMALVNSLNGLAIGMTSPLLAYWFSQRFGVGPGALGPVFALTFFATGLASVVTGKITERIGIVRAVVSLRLASVALLVVVPIVPVFWLAALLHIARSALGRGSVGARQALAVSLVRDERRGVASSLNNLSMALPNSLGPGIAGAMLEAGHLGLPFFVAAALQFAYGSLYGALFQRYEPSRRVAAA